MTRSYRTVHRCRGVANHSRRPLRRCTNLRSMECLGQARIEPDPEHRSVRPAVPRYQTGNGGPWPGISPSGDGDPRPVSGRQASRECLSWTLAEVIAHDLEQSRAILVRVAKGPKYYRVSVKCGKRPMRTVNMREAKIHLSRLVEAAAKGESIIIARAGKPMVKVVALDAPDARHRIGFLAGQITVPDDFDSMGSQEIRTLFSGRD